MKKIVVLIFVVMAALSAKAQFYVGGNVALWHNDDADNTSFLIEPEFGYNFSERWAVGATLGFAHNSKETVGFKNAFSFTYFSKPFVKCRHNRCFCSTECDSKCFHTLKFTAGTYTVST